MTGGPGEDALSPWRIPAGGWVAALKRTAKEMGDDNIGLIAAGTAFYGFASIVPVLAAVVLSYGLFADQATVVGNIQSLFASLPREAASVIQDQLLTVVRTEGGKKGLGLLIALALALFGATKAASAIVTALNVAYERKEKRGTVKLYLLYFAIVLGAVLLILGAIAATGVLAFLSSLIPNAPGLVVLLIRLLGYAAIAALAVTAGAALYRYGPDRASASWAWLTPGSAIATVLWLAGTALFGLYVANFANYGATYGSLSAIIVLLTWLWLTAYVFLFGAELNSELERQTEPDTPAGVEKRNSLRAPGAGRKAELAPTLATAVGLAGLAHGGRRPGAGPSARLGAALIVAGAALAWLGREKRKGRPRVRAAPGERP